MSDQSVLRAATTAKFRELIVAFDASRERVDEFNQAIAAEQALQDHLQTQAQKCYATAELFGFDLVAALAAEADRSDGPASITTFAPSTIPAWTASRPTVREFILERAREAYPNAVRAKSLKAEYERTYGGDIHVKTMGMTLYRTALRDGSMRRLGWDWFYVPPELRVVESETQELPYGS